METRNICVIPFLNLEPLKEICGNKCPTKMDVFRFFFFLHYVEGETLASATKTVVETSKEFWSAAGIVTKKDEYAVKDLIKINKEFRVCFQQLLVQLFLCCDR